MLEDKALTSRKGKYLLKMHLPSFKNTFSYINMFTESVLASWCSKKIKNTYYGFENKQGTVVHSCWERARRHRQTDKTAARKLQKHKAWTGHCVRTLREVDILCKYRFLNTKKCCHTSIGFKEVKRHQSDHWRKELPVSPGIIWLYLCTTAHSYYKSKPYRISRLRGKHMKYKNRGSTIHSSMTEGQLATSAVVILTCNFIWKNTSQKNNIHSPNYKGNPTSNSAGINSLYDRKTNLFFMIQQVAGYSSFWHLHRSFTSRKQRLQWCSHNLNL